MNLSEMSAKKRREVIELALDAVLRKATAALPTFEVVKGVAEILGSSESDLIAGILDRYIKPAHPCAQPTGETFKRYGREMRRWHWLPIGSKARRAPSGMTPESPEDIAARAARQRAAESPEDLWTIKPEDV